MKLNLITNIEDLRIKHLKVFDILKEEEITIMKKIELVSIYTGIDKDKLRLVKVDDLINTFDKIVKVLAKYKQKEIPLVITIEGKEFELVQNFVKLPVGWFIDSSSVDFEENPELMPAFCYIEKGMGYAEKDKHQNLLNPLKDRAELFKKHLPLTAFLDLSGFFLHKQKLLKIYYKAKEVKELKKKKLFTGKN
jgi:hypothetical protein